jgi:hypothetical protein
MHLALHEQVHLVEERLEHLVVDHEIFLLQLLYHLHFETGVDML